MGAKNNKIDTTWGIQQKLQVIDDIWKDKEFYGKNRGWKTFQAKIVTGTKAKSYAKSMASEKQSYSIWLVWIRNGPCKAYEKNSHLFLHLMEENNGKVLSWAIT